MRHISGSGAVRAATAKPTLIIPDMMILNHADLPAYGIHFSRPHLIRLEKANRFPKRIQISPGRVGWLKSEIEQWIIERAAERIGAAA